MCNCALPIPPHSLEEELCTEMSTRNIKIIMFLESNVPLVRRADNLTAISKPIV
jgi:hypothetical protein